MTSASSAAPAARAPTEPARVATMLYVPNSRVAEPSAVKGSIACSSDVNGPDSTTSVEIVPVRAARTNQNTDPVTAKTAPETPIASNKARYARRRPTRSPKRASNTETTAMPTSSAASTSPASRLESRRSASVMPITTLPRP